MPLWRSNKSKSSRSSSGGGEASGSKTSLLKKIKSKLSGSKSKMKSKVKSLKSKTDQSGPDSETDVDPSEIDDDSSHTQSTTRTRNSSFSSGESEESGRYRGGRIKKKRYKKTERDFENTDKSGVYHIMIRIIEGRDLPGVNLRVKALVDGRSESTRVSSEKDPRWRQNLSFTLNRSMEKMSDTVFELKLYSENRIARDKLHGEWNCFLGSILHQPDRAIISKWVALRRPRRDNETIVNETENVGFLRISIAIYGNNETPPPMADDESHELFSGAQLQQFTLAVRLFRLHALATRMREPWRKDRDRKSEKSQDPPYYAVRVTVGDSSAESNAESITLSEGYFVIALNREIMLPIMWPTVINKIHFALILSKGKKTRRIVARSSIRLNSIYVAGEDGFLPTFGPSFINFYGPQRVPRLKRRREKHPEKDFDEHMYYCRLLVSVDCFDTPSDDSTVAEISVDAHKFATPFEKYFKYVMCGSFFICSNIDPSFSTSSLMFLVSIGNYGSSDMHGINERSSTLATIPYYDGTKCFTIPWGNYKPLVYIPCGFDRSAFRIERINAIMKVVTLLDHYIDEARVNADQSSPEDVASITVEAIEHTCKKLDSLFNHHRSYELSTPLDFDRYQASRRMMEEMKGELVDLKFTGLKPADTVVDSMRLLCRIREWVGSIWRKATRSHSTDDGTMADGDSDRSEDEMRARYKDENEFHLTDEQKKAARKLTQMPDGVNSNAIYKERSEIREHYYTMSNKVQEATRELAENGKTDLLDTEEGYNEVEGMLTKAHGFYNKIGASTKELACDAHFMKNISQLMLASIQKLHKAHIEKTLRPKDFVEKILETSTFYNDEPIKLISSDPSTSDLLDDSDDEEEFRPNNAKKRLPDGVENDGVMPATQWASFGRRFGSFLKIAPTLTYFRPLLQETAPLPQQPKAKRERLPKDDKSKAKAVVLCEKDKNHDDPDQSVTRELDCIRKSLRREMRKQKSRIIPYYWFVIDPTDFSKSVENMFYTSFLVKDNHIRIEIDQQKGLPMIVLQAAEGDDEFPLSATAAPSTIDAAAGENCTATQQAIVGFAYDIWEGMIECLNITEPVIRR